ncbi:hypothetical protein BASA81_003527 [Batrachochytrium salamandrivorans]|nr:hypothetical protein BASA81_003527 [Batrachochytrium salamandrivorans]
MAENSGNGSAAPPLPLVEKNGSMLLLVDAVLKQRLCSVVEEHKNTSAELERQWQAMIRLGPKINKLMSSKPIKINVGGQQFATELANLVRVPDTLFSSLFGGGYGDSEVFIDRDPTVFGQVLNFLRTDRLDLDCLTPSQLAALREDAAFYEIPPLISLLAGPRFSPQTKSNVQLDASHRFANSFAATANPSCVISSSPFSPHLLERKIRLIKGNEVMIGIAPRTVMDPGSHHLNCGWYLHYSATSDRITLYGQNGQKGKDHCPNQVKPNSVIAVRLNSEFNISFTVDEFSLGVAFRNVAVDHTSPPLHLAVWFRDKLAEVEILQ